MFCSSVLRAPRRQRPLPSARVPRATCLVLLGLDDPSVVRTRRRARAGNPGPASRRPCPCAAGGRSWATAASGASPEDSGSVLTGRRGHTHLEWRAHAYGASPTHTCSRPQAEVTGQREVPASSSLTPAASSLSSPLPSRLTRTCPSSSAPLPWTLPAPPLPQFPSSLLPPHSSVPVSISRTVCNALPLCGSDSIHSSLVCTQPRRTRLFPAVFNPRSSTR